MYTSVQLQLQVISLELILCGIIESDICGTEVTGSIIRSDVVCDIGVDIWGVLFVDSAGEELWT